MEKKSQMNNILLITTMGGSLIKHTQFYGKDPKLFNDDSVH